MRVSVDMGFRKAIEGSKTYGMVDRIMLRPEGGRWSALEKVVSQAIDDALSGRISGLGDFSFQLQGLGNQPIVVEGYWPQEVADLFVERVRKLASNS